MDNAISGKIMSLLSDLLSFLKRDLVRELHDNRKALEHQYSGSSTNTIPYNINKNIADLAKSLNKTNDILEKMHKDIKKESASKEIKDGLKNIVDAINNINQP